MNDSRESMSAQNFEQIWSKVEPICWDYYPGEEGGDTFVLKNRIVRESITLPQIEGNYPKIVLINCEFYNIKIQYVSVLDIHIEASEIRQLDFVQSTIGHISISNSKIQNIYSEETISAGLFIGFNSKIASVRINRKSSFVSFLLHGDSLLDSFFIQNESKCGNVGVKDSTIKGIFHVRDNSKIGDLDVTKSYLGSFGLLHVCSAGRIVISVESRVNKFDIINSVAEYINIAGNSQIGEVRITEQSNLISISIDNSITGIISLKESIINNIEILNESKLLGLILHYLKPESRRLTIHNSFIQEFEIQPDRPYQINVNASIIWTLNLTEKIFPREFIFSSSDTFFNAIRFESFINLGTVILNCIRPIRAGLIYETVEDGKAYFDKSGKYVFQQSSRDSVIKIVNTDLGKVNFIGCRLDEFNQFIFLNSKVLDIFLADTQLPKKGNIVTIDSKGSIIKDREKKANEQRRLALSQFKKAFESRGDVVSTMNYYALEMEAYRDSLTNNGNNPIRSNRWWWHNGERFNLAVNRYSSYYGDNWLRAVAVTLIADAILFTWYCRCLGFRYGSNWAKFWDLASYSFEFLNPIRKADFIKDIPTTTSARAVDYISRIIMAYLVYQTIAAFRKFGKK